MSAFTKATRTKRPLKMAIFGPSGSGKTMTALKLAMALARKGRIALIDTERSSASAYADLFDFDAVSLTSYGVQDYINLIKEAAGAYDCLIIDSLSHAWEAKGGILERVDEIQKAKQYRDSMRAWGDVKPEEARLWDTLLDCPCHIIATMRSKTAYEISKTDKGKMQVEKLGLAPIQRGDKEYEFDIVGRMDNENTLVIEKSRCIPLTDKPVWAKPGAELAGVLTEWLGQGAEAPEPEPPDPSKVEWIDSVVPACKTKGFKPKDVWDVYSGGHNGEGAKYTAVGEVAPDKLTALAEAIRMGEWSPVKEGATV